MKKLTISIEGNDKAINSVVDALIGDDGEEKDGSFIADTFEAKGYVKESGMKVKLWVKQETIEKEGNKEAAK